MHDMGRIYAFKNIQIFSITVYLVSSGHSIYTIYESTPLSRLCVCLCVCVCLNSYRRY